MHKSFSNLKVIKLNEKYFGWYPCNKYINSTSFIQKSNKYKFKDKLNCDEKIIYFEKSNGSVSALFSMILLSMFLFKIKLNFFNIMILIIY